jgi:hypothetical protein
MASIVSDNFRIFASQQFIESLAEPYEPTIVNATSIVVGSTYTIKTLGNTNWQLVGAPEGATEGTIFTAIAVGTGTGTVWKLRSDSDDSAKAFRSKIYLFIGRPQAWNPTTVAEKYSSLTTDTAPSPVDSIDELNEIFDDMISLKRITATDVSPVIRRRIWKTGTVYDMYRHDYSPSNLSVTGASKLYDSQFYVINDQYQVYKCIYNGYFPGTYPNGRVSTVQPSGTSTSIINTSDGYKWKYMYSLTINDYIKFVSSDFMAIKKDDNVSAAATEGTIEQCIVSNTGSGLNYTTATTYYTPILGDGTNGAVQITVGNTSPNTGKITSASIINVGSGYTFGTIDLTKCYTTYSSGTFGGTTVDLGTATNAKIVAIISPAGGHGTNPVAELGGYRVMINKSLDFLDGDGDIPVDMQFRRFGLISDPQISGDDFLSPTGTVCKAIAFPLETTTSFIPGEIITQDTTGAKGRVVHWDSVNKVLRYYQNEYISAAQLNTNAYKLISFSGANAIKSASNTVGLTPRTSFSTASGETFVGRTFSSGYSNSEITKNSGNILYIENRSPVTRADDQIEDIKLVIEF